MGLYVYLFARGRFRLLYFEKEDEEERKASQQAWEKEIDRRQASMAETYVSFRNRLGEVYPSVRCFQGPSRVRYPWPALDVTCTENDSIVSINMEYLSTSDDAADRIKSELQFLGLPKWRPLGGLGDQGIDADECSRAWIRFRKGTIYVWMNANMNIEEKDIPKCSNEQNIDSKKLNEFSKRIALVFADLINGP
jgi:hypothetical protein